MDEQKNQNTAMDWDSAITQDEYVADLLPKGEYNFFVERFERGHFPGSAKLPEAPKAILYLKVAGPDGAVSFRQDLIICRALEWKLSEFFRSIGQKKHDEPLVPRWNEVEGSQGRAIFAPRTYKTSSGEERNVNSIERFLDFDPKNFPDGWIQEAKNCDEGSLEDIF